MKDSPSPTFSLSPKLLSGGALQFEAASTIAVSPASRSGIRVSWAQHEDEVRAAQKLRFDVFAGEMGAQLACKLPGHDIDLFDDYCEHLLVRDALTEQVIGTYRVLTPAQAKRAGGTYSDTEFDLTRLRSIRSRMVELGRSCVHPDHRHGGVILALWGALFEFMNRNQLDTMIGCASIPMLHNGMVSGDVAAVDDDLFPASPDRADGPLAAEDPAVEDRIAPAAREADGARVEADDVCGPADGEAPLRARRPTSAGQGAIEQGAAEGEGLDLAVDLLGEVAGLRAEDDTAAGPQGGADGAGAGAAGALLGVRLLATTADFAAGLGRARALAGVGAVGDDDFLDGLEAAGAFKGRKVEFLLGTLGGVGSEKFELHVMRSPVA